MKLHIFVGLTRKSIFVRESNEEKYSVRKNIDEKSTESVGEEYSRRMFRLSEIFAQEL